MHICLVFCTQSKMSEFQNAFEGINFQTLAKSEDLWPVVNGMSYEDDRYCITDLVPTDFDFAGVFDKFPKMSFTKVFDHKFFIEKQISSWLVGEKVTPTCSCVIAMDGDFEQTMKLYASPIISNYVSLYIGANNSPLLGAYVEKIKGQMKAYADAFSMIELQQSRLVQREKMAALGEMAGGVAHEINNPLTVIHGNAEHILELLGNPAEYAMERLRYSATKIQNTALRITKVVKSLRNFARDGSSDPFEKSELRWIIEDAIELCRQKFHEKGIQLEVPHIGEDVKVECRPIEISQVILNLLINAYDAVLNSEEKLIKIEVEKESDWLNIRVIDTGCGISDEIQENMMKAFFTTKAKGNGTGLGLSISSTIVQAHGGVLRPDTTHSCTCMLLQLPLSH